MNFRLTRPTLDPSVSVLALIFAGLVRACG